MSIQTNVGPGSVLYRFRGVTIMIITSDLAGIFSVSCRIALFPHPAGTTSTVSLQSVNFFSGLKFI